MEDLNLYLKDVLTERPNTRVPSADTVLRGIEELATENISYTAEKTGNVYDFNTAEKLNQLLIKLYDRYQSHVMLVKRKWHAGFAVIFSHGASYKGKKVKG